MRSAKNKWLVLCIVIVFPVIFPLFTSYVPGTADGLAHKFRLVSFEKSLIEGNWRPRWLSDQALGFGSPIFLFNYLLPYYLIAGINFLGANINRSVQIYQAATLVLSFIFMYLLVNKLWGRLAAVSAASIYTWAPYHLLTVYLYEGWGEMTAFVFPPWIIYLTIRVLREMGKIRDFFLLVVTWVLFILSHNVSVVMFTPVLIFLSFVISQNEAQPRWRLWLLGALGIGVMLTAFFWLPAISMNSLTAYPDLIAQEINMRGSHFKSLTTLINVAVSTVQKGNVGYYDFTVGLPIFVAISLGILYALKSLLYSTHFFVHPKKWMKERVARWRFSYFSKLGLSGGPSPIPLSGTGSPHFNHSQREIKENAPRAKFPHFFDYLVIWLFIIFLLSLYLSNYSSNWLWDLRPLHFIVYPFRFLFLATFAGSLLAGWLAKRNILVVLAFIIFAIASGRPYTNPYLDRFPFADAYFRQPQMVTYAPGTFKNMATTEFLPKTANFDFLKGEEEKFLLTKKLPVKILLQEKGEVSEVYLGAEKLQAKVETEVDNLLTINTFFFPNWQAEVDGLRKEIITDKVGRMTIRVGQGRHDVKLVFGVSRIEKAANIISLLGILILVGQIYIFNRFVFKRWIVRKT